MLTQNSVTSFASVPLALGIYLIILLPAKDEWVSSENVTSTDGAAPTQSPQSDPNVVSKKSTSPKWSFKPFGRPARTEGSTPGVVRPDKARRKKLHKKAKEPEEVEEDDPSDDIVNANLTVDGILIYQQNPCRKYKEKPKFFHKSKNYEHKKGCKKAAKHVKAYIQITGRSLPNCPDPGQGRCFEFQHSSGRCYILVNTNAPREARKFELINNCFYSPMTGILPPAAVPPPPSPSPLAGVPPQQPLSFPAGG